MTGLLSRNCLFCSGESQRGPGHKKRSVENGFIATWTEFQFGASWAKGAKLPRGDPFGVVCGWGGGGEQSAKQVFVECEDEKVVENG